MDIGYIINSHINKVIRLGRLVYISQLLRLFCYLNKVKMRLFTIFFVWMNDTKLSITLFIPYFLNKTTLVARRYTPTSNLITLLSNE